MEFRTIVDIPKGGFVIPPCERILFVGSCFADNMGNRFQQEKFRVIANPFGVMYNPASILHTVERLSDDLNDINVAVFTLGTNHVYILKETGEIVDNCQKRPQRLFQEKKLSIAECTEYLCRSVDVLRQHNSSVKVIVTVSPIRYRKYGYHESQLSKSTLLLAANQLCHDRQGVEYFPAYEIVNDELRDYRFYKEDMLHPSDQAVEYIWQRFADTYFNDATLQFLREWKPLREALSHRPFHPESEDYKRFQAETNAKVEALAKRYPGFEL